MNTRSSATKGILLQWKYTAAVQTNRPSRSPPTHNRAIAQQIRQVQNSYVRTGECKVLVRRPQQFCYHTPPSHSATPSKPLASCQCNLSAALSGASLLSANCVGRRSLHSLTASATTLSGGTLGSAVRHESAEHMLVTQALCNLAETKIRMHRMCAYSACEVCDR